MHLYAERFVAKLRSRGLRVRLTCSFRSDHDQHLLYAQGRNGAGHVVTMADAGQSPHNYDLARDYVPIIDGKATYQVPNTWWEIFGITARQSGLRWGGDFSHFCDRPHVELPDWRDRLGDIYHG